VIRVAVQGKAPLEVLTRHLFTEGLAEKLEALGPLPSTAAGEEGGATTMEVDAAPMGRSQDPAGGSPEPVDGDSPEGEPRKRRRVGEGEH